MIENIVIFIIFIFLINIYKKWSFSNKKYNILKYNFLIN